MAITTVHRQLALLPPLLAIARVNTPPSINACQHAAWRKQPETQQQHKKKTDKTKKEEKRRHEPMRSGAQDDGHDHEEEAEGRGGGEDGESALGPHEKEAAKLSADRAVD